MSKIPDVTQQVIEHVDGTPNEEYAFRILKAYRENCNCKWISEDDPFLDMMNEHQDKRAMLLDEAIEKLEKRVVFEITERDVQVIAKEIVGRELSEEEIDQVEAGITGGFDVGMDIVIREAIRELKVG